MYGIMNAAGTVIWFGTIRTMAIRLAGTRTLAGTVVVWAGGGWRPIA